METLATVKPLHPEAPLRHPDKVMRLERMGSFFPTRLSFMRTTIRQLLEQKVRVECPVWEMDDEGYGRAVYSVRLFDHVYSLVAFSSNIPPEKRTDRVIAEMWDSAYVLFDGVPTDADLDRLERNAPKQEAGRFEACDLVLSRANKSVRLFDHVATCLAAGQQPEEKMISEIGYLMRTTAVYGNGKFGIADRARIMNRRGLSGPFQAEMLTVWLIRNFTHDLVEHIAKRKSPDTATVLDTRLKRHLGIGNSTGLGMAPFLVSHPILLNNWMVARETAIARVAAVKRLEPEAVAHILSLLQRVEIHLTQWNVPDKRQMDRVLQLRSDFAEVMQMITEDFLAGPGALQQIMDTSQKWSIECQELLVAILMEPLGHLVDGLADCMASISEPRLEPAMTLAQLRTAIDDNYRWAMAIDSDDRRQSALFWYVSEEKLEPRLGSRFEEPGCELELPHDIALRVRHLLDDINAGDPKASVASFLMVHPEHRYMVRRVQACARHPYSEIRDNLVADTCLPIDMLRCKLSFFGASKFDPKSDRWTRITMYQGAPLPDEVASGDAVYDDWFLPVLEPAP
jgi:hypothetical protein